MESILHTAENTELKHSTQEGNIHSVSQGTPQTSDTHDDITVESAEKRTQAQPEDGGEYTLNDFNCEGLSNEDAQDIVDSMKDFGIGQAQATEIFNKARENSIAMEEDNKRYAEEQKERIGVHFSQRAESINTMLYQLVGQDQAQTLQASITNADSFLALEKILSHCKEPSLPRANTRKQSQGLEDIMASNNPQALDNYIRGK